MSDPTDQRAERFERFKQFVATHFDAFANTADAGFAKRGRGAVLLETERLEGGEEFRPQEFLPLGYMGQRMFERLAPKDATVLNRYKPPGEAIFLVVYPDLTFDHVVVDVAGFRRQHPPSDAYEGITAEEPGIWPDNN